MGFGIAGPSCGFAAQGDSAAYTNRQHAIWQQQQRQYAAETARRPPFSTIRLRIERFHDDVLRLLATRERGIGWNWGLFEHDWTTPCLDRPPAVELTGLGALEPVALGGGAPPEVTDRRWQDLGAVLRRVAAADGFRITAERAAVPTYRVEWDDVAIAVRRARQVEVGTDAACHPW